MIMVPNNRNDKVDKIAWQCRTGIFWISPWASIERVPSSSPTRLIAAIDQQMISVTTKAPLAEIFSSAAMGLRRPLAHQANVAENIPTPKPKTIPLEGIFVQIHVDYEINKRTLRFEQKKKIKTKQYTHNYIHRQ